MNRLFLLALAALLLGSSSVPPAGDAWAPAGPTEYRSDPVPSWTCGRGDLAALVEESSRAAGIPSWVLARLISAESGWKPEALGPVNKNGTQDLGICQFNDRFLDYFAATLNGGKPFDPMDPAQAVPVAARYLAELYRQTGDWALAVAAYNCGLGRVRSGRIPERTRRHVARVMGHD